MLAWCMLRCWPMRLKAGRSAKCCMDLWETGLELSARSQQDPGAVSLGSKSELLATSRIVSKHRCGVLLEATLLQKRCSLPRTLEKTPTPPLRLRGNWLVHCTARRVFSVLGLSGLLGRGVLMGWLMHFWAQLTVTDQRSLL